MNKLEKKDIINAIEEYKSLYLDGNIKSKNESIMYDLVYDNVKYPVKLIVSIAHEKVYPDMILDRSNFNSLLANKTVEVLGFDIKKREKRISTYLPSNKDDQNNYIGREKVIENIKKYKKIFHSDLNANKDFTFISKNEFKNEYLVSGGNDQYSLKSFIYDLQFGSLVFLIMNNSNIKMILKISGNYKYNPSPVIPYSHHERSVQILWEGNVDISDDDVKKIRASEQVNFIDGESSNRIDDFIDFFDKHNDAGLEVLKKQLKKEFSYDLKERKNMTKEELKVKIERFINQTKTNDQTTRQYAGEYNNCILKTSFGAGALAKIPWIAFLNYDQEVQNGIYPGLLLDKEKEILYVTYCVSATNKPQIMWDSKILIEKMDIRKYKESFVAAKFTNIYDNLDLDNVVTELNKVINLFHKQFEAYQSPVDKKKEIENMRIEPLNQILYGPPGTGKTYNTINKAIEVIENRKLSNEELDNRSLLKEQFNKYKELGQIEFVTFHQSYGYEEFVEGIKALPSGADGNDSDEMIYDVVPGIFKKLSQKAHDSKVLPLKDKPKEFTLNAPQLNIQARMIQEDENIFRVLAGSKIRKDNSNTFKLQNLKNKILNTIKNSEEDEWFLMEEDYPFKSMSGSSSVILGRQSNGFKEWKEVKENIEIDNKLELKNYVLIIDEINRGNISKIFGELITLIEDSKRAGNKEKVEITLPYSGDMFSVPNNLYILGTMNTADRSIALMDTALRRRFHFEEMMPNTELLDFEVEGINIKAMIDVINQRIEYLYDRDHMIGHAYFINLEDNPSIKELDNIFKNKVIPLLQEYFYDDWEKIQMVLGDHIEQKEQDENKFIVSKKQEEKKLFGFDHDDIEDDQIIFTVNESFSIDAYKKIKL